MFKTESCRQGLFDGFWKSANFDLQNAYVCGCVKVLSTKKKYTKAEESCRNFSRVFYVQNGSISERVYKTAFVSIFGILNGPFNSALQAQASDGGVPHTYQQRLRAAGKHFVAEFIGETLIMMQC